MRYAMLPVFLIGVTLSGQMSIENTGDKMIDESQAPAVTNERQAIVARLGTNPGKTNRDYSRSVTCCPEL